jgi:hypothetical protein
MTYNRNISSSVMNSLVTINSLPLSNVGLLPHEASLLDEKDEINFRCEKFKQLISKLAITHSDKIFTPIRLRRTGVIDASIPVPEGAWPNPAAGEDYRMYRFVVWHVSKAIGEVPLELGDVWVGNDLETFNITNERIQGGLQRGNERSTTKLDRAVSIFNRNFYPPTPAELLKIRALGLRNGVKEGRSKVYSTDELFKRFTRFLRPHIESHLEEFLELARTLGAEPAKFGKYPEQLEETTTIKDVMQHMEEDKGCAVILKGADYYVSNADQVYKYRYGKDSLPAHQVHQFATGTLPTDIKRGVGMLKLLKDGTYLRGVGYRLNADTFYIQNAVCYEPEET